MGAEVLILMEAEVFIFMGAGILKKSKKKKNIVSDPSAGPS